MAQYLSKELRTAIAAVCEIKTSRDYDNLLSLLANASCTWESISDALVRRGYVAPRGWPAPSGTREELLARDEAECKAEARARRAATIERKRAEEASVAVSHPL